MDRANLTINGAEFDSLKKKAAEKHKEDWGDEEPAGYAFNELDFSIDEIDFKDGTMTICGSLMDKNESNKPVDLGYTSFEFDFNIETAIPVIEYYMKQVNKMKTVLEAIK